MEDDKLIALAERLAELREEKRYVDGEIDKVGGALAEALEAGTKRTLGSFEVRIAEPRQGLRVTDANLVPETFCTSQPDRKRLLRHIQETGEVPPGIEPTMSKAAVYVKPLVDPENAR